MTGTDQTLTLIKALLRLTGTEQDGFLSALLSLADATAHDVCRADETVEFPSELLARMVVEDYNRAGSEGISHRNISALTEAYRAEYSPAVMEALARYRVRKLRVM